MNIVLDNSSCCSKVMNKNQLDDRMFIARLTSTHLIYKHCGFGIWVNFDALLCRIIFQVFLLHMQNLPGNLHDMIFKCNLLVYCHQGVTVLWQPNVRPF